MLFPMDTVLILGIIQFQLCDSFAQFNQQIITNNSTWVVGVRRRIDSKYQPPGFNSENVEEGVEAIEMTFEAKAEAYGYSHRKKVPELDALLVIIVIIFICYGCCACYRRYSEINTEYSNPSPNRQPNHRAYRIQTQSPGHSESHFTAPANQMRGFTLNMFTDSNDGVIDWSRSSSAGGATVTAPAPTSTHSRSPRAYRIQTHPSVLPPASSTDPSALAHQVRRNLTPSPCRSQKPVAVAKEDEIPPSYDQCILIPTTIPDPHANATAPPQENEERLPPYIFK